MTDTAIATPPPEAAAPATGIQWPELMACVSLVLAGCLLVVFSRPMLTGGEMSGWVAIFGWNLAGAAILGLVAFAVLYVLKLRKEKGVRPLPHLLVLLAVPIAVTALLTGVFEQASGVLTVGRERSNALNEHYTRLTSLSDEFEATIAGLDQGQPLSPTSLKARGGYQSALENLAQRRAVVDALVIDLGAELDAYRAKVIAVERDETARAQALAALDPVQARQREELAAFSQSHENLMNVMEEYVILLRSADGRWQARGPYMYFNRVGDLTDSNALQRAIRTQSQQVMIDGDRINMWVPRAGPPQIVPAEPTQRRR